MKKPALLLSLAACWIPSIAPAQDLPPLRPPSVPLVACDPYFSIWSPHDQLNGGDTTHWTDKKHALGCVATIDGKTYQIMGTPGAHTPPLPQTKLEVLPTRTIYTFAGAGIELRVTFMTP